MTIEPVIWRPDPRRDPATNLAARHLAYRPVIEPSPMACYRPPVVRRVHGETVLLRPAADADGGGNFIAAFAPEPSPDGILRLASDFFGAGAAFELLIDSDRWGAAEAELITRGLDLVEEEPGLIRAPLPLIEAMPVPSPELDVRLVDSARRLADFFSVSRSPRSVVPSVACARDPGVGVLVGYQAGMPIATARFSLTDKLADITGVTVEPSYRHRGHGTAITWAAIAEAARRGATAATLTATEMGYPLYLKMGFEPVCLFRTYRFHGSAPPSRSSMNETTGDEPARAP